jgi:CheY-like chemotaxis protein
MNFATNARDAMPAGGELKVETSNIYLDDVSALLWKGAKTGPHIMLSVSDAGCGMDQAVQAHIFEPFYTTKPVGQGTGLGLSTVYGIVKQSGGLIAVESAPGCGTTFRILVPGAHNEDSPNTTAFPKKATLDGSETILVVEDEKNVRNMVRRMLMAAGYKVMAAESGEQALRLCKECPDAIDILITDVVMPNMDGRELKASVKLLRPEIKTLFMSGYTGEAIAQHGVQECGTEFIAKPFDATELKTKIRELLDRRPSIAPSH